MYRAGTGARRCICGTGTVVTFFLPLTLLAIRHTRSTAVLYAKTSPSWVRILSVSAINLTLLAIVIDHLQLPNQVMHTGTLPFCILQEGTGTI